MFNLIIIILYYFREIIAFVESITSPEKAGNQILQKCILSNDNGCKIMTKIWNEQIDRVKEFIKPNYVSIYNYII